MDPRRINTLIIDNYDSYTFNLLQICTTNVTVIRNDQFTWQEFVNTILPHVDNIIISPGPGRPDRAKDVGLCGPLLRAQCDPTTPEWHRPLLGVCLGHQGIAHVMGGKVILASRVMHGRRSLVQRQPCTATKYTDIFEHVPSSFWAVRYHSLVADPSCIPSDLIVTATCQEDDADVEALQHETFCADDDGIVENTCIMDQNKKTYLHALPHAQGEQTTIMAFQHAHLPLWGVQFHPESISSEYGSKMVLNFTNETHRWMQKMSRLPRSDKVLQSVSVVNPSPSIPRPLAMASPWRLVAERVHCGWIDPAQVVERFLTDQRQQGKVPRAVSWLDSSRSSSRYSTLSIFSVDPALTVSYSTCHRQVRRIDRQGSCSYRQLDRGETFFDVVSQELVNIGRPACSDLPDSIRFHGGWIGYLGYEMKRESMPGYTIPVEQTCTCPSSEHYNGCCSCARQPDAAFQWIDRYWAFDHVRRAIYVCCLVNDGGKYAAMGMTPKAADFWVKDAIQTVKRAVDASTTHRHLVADYLTPASSACSTPKLACAPSPIGHWVADMGREAYVDAIQHCVQDIKQGESYELCLTTQFRRQVNPEVVQGDTHDPILGLWQYYLYHLRPSNPAPYAALLLFPESNIAVMSSSPERFLQIQDGVAEMKPIKGTIARVLDCVCPEGTCDAWGPECLARRRRADEVQMQTLWQDVKERAENLMIVDLIRNDLAQVCDPASVKVPKLMHVETYEKVHHLVSTIQGHLRPGIDSVSALQTCFPPGSMTGAPKLRSVELLDAHEGNRRRGVYSGCVGYFSLNGDAEFNVVIRTLVAMTEQNEAEVSFSVGGGGAITFLSEPECEWNEAVLKTKSVIPSLEAFLSSQ